MKSSTVNSESDQKSFNVLQAVKFVWRIEIKCKNQGCNNTPNSRYSFHHNFWPMVQYKPRLFFNLNILFMLHFNNFCIWYSSDSIRDAVLANWTSVNRWAGCAYGGCVWWSDNCTGPSLNLIKRNVPQINITGANKGIVVTVTVFGNEEKKYRSCTWRSICPPVLSSRLSYRILVTFLPEKQHLSPAKNFHYRVFVMKKKNHLDGQPSWPRLQWTFPWKTAFILTNTESDSDPFTDGDYAIKHKKRNFVTFQDVWWVRISITFL